MKTLYFKNLNALRFLAALMVMLHHFGLNNQINLRSFFGEFVLIIGKLGVVLFFTLSGFLITYLLISEKQNKGRVDIKFFYIRRMLRIWPLYFLIVIGALFVFNSIMYFRIPYFSTFEITHNFTAKCLLYICMLPNVAYAFGYNLPFADQCWSIGVEEQYYLFWPVLFNKFSKPINALLTVIIVYLIIKTISFLLLTNSHTENAGRLYFFINLLAFDTMAIGGIFAILLHEKKKIIEFILKKEFQIALFMLVPGLIIFSVNFGFFHFEVYSLLFALLIVILASSFSLVTMEQKQIKYLGKISYGLYMYHLISIRITNLISEKFNYLEKFLTLKFLIMVFITIIISTISYELFEKLFIKKKRKYSVILSGDNV